jgi:hypothetical protein
MADENEPPASPETTFLTAPVAQPLSDVIQDSLTPDTPSEPAPAPDLPVPSAEENAAAADEESGAVVEDESSAVIEPPPEEENAVMEDDDDEEFTVSAPKIQITPTEEGTVGILNFEDTFGQETLPKFTEGSTVAAMKRLFIEPKDLIPPADTELTAIGIPEFADVRKKVQELYAKRRKSLISEIIQEREVVISERKRATERSQASSRMEQQTSREKVAEQVAIEKIEAMQRREIEMLIVSELLREKAVRDGIERQARRDEQTKAFEEEVKKRQQADRERRAEKTQVLMVRIQERERELLELQKKQNEQIEKSQRMIAEAKAKRLKDMADADVERQKKAQAQREALDKQLEEEKKKIMQRQKEDAAREKILIQKRADRAREVKEKSERVMEEQRIRFQEIKAKMAQALEDRRKSQDQRDIEVAARFQSLIKARDERAQSLRAKSEQQLHRNLEARSTIAEQKAERIRELVFKDTKDQERRDAIAAKRLERQKHEREIELEKKAHIERQNQSRLEERRQKEVTYTKKMQEEEERLSVVFKKKEEELAKVVAIRTIRDKFRDEGAERRAKQFQAKRERQEVDRKEREAVALLYVESVQELAIKKRDTATELTFKKEAAIHGFREFIARGGRLDIDVIGKKFGIDVEFLRQKVNASRSGVAHNPA